MGSQAATETLKKTPLFEEHVRLKARIVPFAGYEMPVQYTGVIDEHHAVRNAAGLFDVSHMGLASFQGKRVLEFLNFVLTRDVSALPQGKGAYSLLCREDGGCIDDLIIYRKNEDEVLAVFNASNKEKDFAHISALAREWKIECRQLFDELSLIALQGPESPKILKALGYSEDLHQSFLFNHASLAGIDAQVAHTGYTGEIGCEIAVKNEKVVELWQKVLEVGAPFGLKPAGLAARDTLRTEMGFSLYGHELSETINPVEAGLSWAIGWKKENFVGKEALLRAKENPKRKIVCLSSPSRQAPRAEMKVFDASGKEVGFVTSGTFAPSLGNAIGMALVDFQSQAPYSVEIRSSRVAFEQVKRPFYKKS